MAALAVAAATDNRMEEGRAEAAGNVPPFVLGPGPALASDPDLEGERSDATDVL